MNLSQTQLRPLATIGGKNPATFLLPPDLINPDIVSELLSRIDARLNAGCARLTIDGHELKWCNSAFAEAMIQIALRIRRCGAACEVRGLPEHALDVIDLCKLRPFLARAGMVLLAAA